MCPMNVIFYENIFQTITVPIFKIIGKFFSKNARFLKKPNFYLLVFIYITKFSNLTTFLERVDEFY